MATRSFVLFVSFVVDPFPPPVRPLSGTRNRANRPLQFVGRVSRDAAAGRGNLEPWRKQVMSNNPYESPDTTGKSLAKGRRMRTHWLVKTIAVVAVLALLIALCLPAVRTARPSALRMSCSNNLKQIALALLNYETDYHALPLPARSTRKDNRFTVGER